MNAILVATTLFLTVLLAVVAGIGLSWLAASGILRAFGHRPRKASPALTAAPAGTSGD